MPGRITAVLAAAALAAAAMSGCGPSPGDDGPDRPGDDAATVGGQAADTAPARRSPAGGPAADDTMPESAASQDADRDPDLPANGEPASPGDSAGDEPPACEDTVPDPREEETMEDTVGSAPTIHDVLERHRDGWMERPGVIGTGVGRCDGDPCLVIYLRRLTDELEAELPDCVEGYRVRLEETGTVTPRGGTGGPPGRASAVG